MLPYFNVHGSFYGNQGLHQIVVIVVMLLWGLPGRRSQRRFGSCWNACKLKGTRVSNHCGLEQSNWLPEQRVTIVDELNTIRV